MKFLNLKSAVATIGLCTASCSLNSPSSLSQSKHELCNESFGSGNILGPFVAETKSDIAIYTYIDKSDQSVIFADSRLIDTLQIKGQSDSIVFDSEHLKLFGFRYSLQTADLALFKNKSELSVGKTNRNEYISLGSIDNNSSISITNFSAVTNDNQIKTGILIISGNADNIRENLIYEDNDSKIAVATNLNKDQFRQAHNWHRANTESLGSIGSKSKSDPELTTLLEVLPARFKNKSQN